MAPTLIYPMIYFLRSPLLPICLILRLKKINFSDQLLKSICFIAFPSNSITTPAPKRRSCSILLQHLCYFLLFTIPSHFSTALCACNPSVTAYAAPHPFAQKRLFAVFSIGTLMPHIRAADDRPYGVVSNPNMGVVGRYFRNGQDRSLQLNIGSLVQREAFYSIVK